MISSMPPLPAAAGAPDYEMLADLRYRLRRFLRAREEVARGVGIEPQQYLLLLQIKGLTGRVPTTIGVLAERLQIRHHAAVQLVDRLAGRGLVQRRREGRDRREVVVGLRPAGERVLRQVAMYSLTELTTDGPQIVSTLTRLIRQSTRGKMPSPIGTGKAK